YHRLFAFHPQNKTGGGLLVQDDLHAPISTDPFPILFLVVFDQGLQDEEQKVIRPLFPDDPLIVKDALADPIKMIPFLFLDAPDKILGHHKEQLFGSKVLILSFDDLRGDEQLILEFNDLVPVPLVGQQPQQKVIQLVFHHHFFELIPMVQAVGIDPSDRFVPLGEQKVILEGKLSARTALGG